MRAASCTTAVAVTLLLAAAFAPRAEAHAGPPYPILMDRVAGPYKLDVWADPDVGIGTFIVYVRPANSGALPADAAVDMFVQPVDRHLPIAAYRAKARHTSHGTRRFDAHVKFETEQSWTVRFRILSRMGEAVVDTVVAATPPGYGPLLDFALALFPFLAIGFLFVKAALARRPAEPARRA